VADDLGRDDRGLPAIGIGMGEPFTPGHALTFALIWTGVILFTLSGRQRRSVIVVD
jgi:EamA domain-containing membrane protein RarD